MEEHVAVKTKKKNEEYLYTDMKLSLGYIF